VTVIEQREITLVVEDDRDNREFLVRLLRGCGVETEAACSVGEAIEKLGTAPKVVLLDMHLPDGSGVDVLQFIRSNRMPMAVGIITGSAEDELAELRTFIPDRVFIKPVNVNEVLTWVQAYNSHRYELSIDTVSNSTSRSAQIVDS
jgi:CheY-like chemotaxis protein